MTSTHEGEAPLTRRCGDPGQGWLSIPTSACARCVALWQLFQRTYPRLPTPDATSSALGFPNRYHMSRWLCRHGHLPHEQLRDWYRVGQWIHTKQLKGRALVREAWGSGTDPSVCYRTVRRITGRPWLEVGGSGRLEWLSKCRTVLLRGACSIRLSETPDLGALG